MELPLSFWLTLALAMVLGGMVGAVSYGFLLWGI